jgi:hypothetical protein
MFANSLGYDELQIHSYKLTLLFLLSSLSFQPSFNLLFLPPGI